ncbi:VOC family protein [Chloroflexi bacterium TSY]|nr:VOC family protein [Chloroflexi bacterium TSY]
MITRFDHAIIATRDLAQATDLFRTQLGLDAQFGGRHTGRGTHNALVRFGLDYLELLSIVDEDELRTAGAGRIRLLDFLRGCEGGLLAYCLATDDIDALADHFRIASLEALGPFAMERTRPDGVVIKWRLLIPGGAAYRKPWPFFIQWDLPDDERLQYETPGTHPLGMTRIRGVSVAVANLENAMHLYGSHLGLQLIDHSDMPALAARRVRYALDSFVIELLVPSGDGSLQEELDAIGEGVYAITLQVSELESARQLLKENGMDVTSQNDGETVLTIDPSSTIGTRLALTAA